MHRRQYIPGSREFKLSRTDLAERNRVLQENLREAREQAAHAEERRRAEANRPRGVRKFIETVKRIANMPIRLPQRRST